MFTQKWKTSERKHEVTVERDIRIPVRDGTILAGDLFRPAAEGKFPVILGAHPYNCGIQTAPLRPIGYGNLRGVHRGGRSGVPRAPRVCPGRHQRARDRPVFQYQYESLRWFDYWLRGIDNGVVDEPPVRLFIPATGE